MTQSTPPFSGNKHESPGKSNDRDVDEVMALLCGLAPTEENLTHLISRSYFFGDSLLDPAHLVSTSASVAAPSSEELALSYFLGLPPTDAMSQVTRSLFKLQSTKQHNQNESESGAESNFSSEQYDVVTLVARECSDAVRRFGTSLYRATHSRRAAGQTRSASRVEMVDVLTDTPKSEQQDASIPEELLAA